MIWRRTIKEKSPTKKVDQTTEKNVHDKCVRADKSTFAYSEPTSVIQWAVKQDTGDVIYTWERC